MSSLLVSTIFFSHNKTSSIGLLAVKNIGKSQPTQGLASRGSERSTAAGPPLSLSGISPEDGEGEDPSF
jgi:hypothetical protein